ncbi:MAG: DUF4175 domain-containing protein [Myxococcota bacterium]
MHQLGTIERIADLYRDETRPAFRRLCVALGVAALVGAAWVGRTGVAGSRAAAAFVALVGVLPYLALRGLARRRRQDPRAVMRATVMHTEPDLAARALRAMTLAEQTVAEPERGSTELAQLHFSRLLGRVSLPQIAARAGRRSWWVTGVGLGVSVVLFAGVVIDPFRVVEGIDVLAARDGVAPMPVRWVQVARIEVEPPSYLQRSASRLRPYRPASVPVGSSISMHAAPRRDGRRLVLTDGAREVPFVDDGEGTLVARWNVAGDADLRVAARFGEVVIPEPRALSLHAIVDHAPFVRLKGAPAAWPLLDQPQIPVHWEAQDDHGLREVALVLRAGDAVVRRPLSNPKSGLVDRGGVELAADDPFLQGRYLPVQVTVEALDNDDVSGPKWGRSDAFILFPPQVGERAALRYRAFESARDAVVDELARRMGLDEVDPTAEEVAHKRLRRVFAGVLEADYGGIRLSGRIAALTKGQLERLDDQVKAAVARRDRAGLVTATEEVLLAIDSGLAALGTGDTRTAALQLADVATETAGAIALAEDPVQRDRSQQLVAAYLEVLNNGGGFMTQLGRLGRDLGELVKNGVRRIRRPLDASDRYHAQLAAEDLAARLRNPQPSFGSAGGGGGGDGHGHGGGVESGGMPQPGQGEASEAAEQAEGLEDALEELRQEHEQAMREVEQALKEAMSPEARQAMAERMRDLAQKVREAVDDLPQQASDPGSARAAAARARAQAESMAGALERGDVTRAMEQGEGALKNLDEAQTRGRRAPEGSEERETGRRAGAAKRALDDLVQQGQQAEQDMQRQASEGAAGPLQQAAGRERALAERARQLRRQSQTGEAPLPEAMLDRLGQAARAMERAADKLGQRQGAQGQRAQRQAQRMLEMAQPERENEGAERDTAPDGDGGDDFARDANVPPEARDKRAEDFRQRVTDGLGREAPPHLEEALRRYTEGLLR